MARTYIFMDGDAQAIQIPAELAYDDGTELEITRVGDVITLVPVRADANDVAPESLSDQRLKRE
jgi:antitoxin VapB